MTTFETYKELQTYNSAFTANTFEVLTKGITAAGRTVVASSDSHYQEARAFRYNSSTVWDLYSPQISLNADQFNAQAKNYNVQAAQAVSTLVNGFTRATNLYAVESNSIYSYATYEHLTGAPVIVQEATKNINYGDYVKIQAGKLSEDPISDEEIDDNYGRMQLGSIYDLTLSSKKGGVTFTGPGHISSVTQGDLFFSAGGKAAIVADKGIGIRSDREISIGTDTSLLLSADSEIIINSRDHLRIDAKYISIGTNGASLDPFNLDLINLASDLAQSAFNDDYNSFLNIPDSIKDYTATFIDALPEQLSGIVESSTTSLFNSLTPGSLQKFIKGMGTDQWLQNIGGVALGNATANLPQFGPAILGALPFLGLAQTAFNRYTGIGFKFDNYPELKPIDPPEFADISEPKASVVVDGNSYAQFPYPYPTEYV